MSQSNHFSNDGGSEAVETVGAQPTRFAKALTIAVYFSIFWILVPGFLLVTGFRLDILWPVAWVSTRTLVPTGAGFAFLGAAILLAAMGQLWFQGKGLPISGLPPTEFVATGLYRIWRHPIYVGFSLLFAGVSCILQSFWSLAFSTPFLILGWIAYVEFYEEPVLLQRFGQSYDRYRARVRLVLPFPKRKKRSAVSNPPATSPSGILKALTNHTVLFRIGPLIVVTYGLLLAVGAMLMALVTVVALIEHDVAIGDANRFIVYTAIAVGPMGWVFWWIGNSRRLIKERFWGFGQIGFVSYGAMMAFAVVCIIASHRLNVNIFLLSDALMLGLFLAYTVGRLGCLTYGCCYGKESHSRFHVLYENPDAKMIRLGDRRHLPRHPVQLYAMAHGFVAFWLLYAISTASVPVGLITALGLIFAGLGRTFTESFRDRSRPFFGRFTWGHLGSWILCLGGWSLLWFVSPQVDADAPIAFSARALAQHEMVFPSVLLTGLIVLIVFGVHWRRIGTWFG